MARVGPQCHRKKKIVGFNNVIIYFTFLALVLEVASMSTGLYLNFLSVFVFFNCLMAAYHKTRNV